MTSPIIITLVVVCIIVVWFAWSLSWTGKQTLLGAWVAALPDGSHVTLQFEGDRKGGTYKQLIKRDGAESREFGHWTINIVELHLIIMATDIKAHPRFGVDTKYLINFTIEDQVTIKGPERPKWIFQRASPDIKIDFDPPKATA